MGQIRNPKAPNLPLPGTVYTPTQQAHLNQLLNALRLYFNQIDSGLQQLLLGFNHYGAFHDTTTQTIAVANTAYPVKFNSTGEAFGISVASNSRLTVTRPGVYSFHFSAQLDNTGGAAHSTYLWLRINGTTNLPHSAVKQVISGTNDEKVVAVNYLASLEADDYVELMWSSDSTNTVLAAIAASAPVPDIASATAEVTYVFPNDVA
jgi:hypothetical protein